MKKLLILAFAFAISLSAQVVSKTYKKTATGEGYGVTYEQAVDNALAEALLKLNGAYVKTKQNAQVSTVTNNNESEIYKHFNQQISKATNGRFSAFEVLEKQQTQDGFRVVVSIKKTSTIKEYKLNDANNDRRRIVVVPALDPNNYSLMGRDSEQVLRDLRFKIESNIHNTRKFNLLDRQSGEALAQEKEIIEADGAKDEALKLGKTLGTDYILLYSISDIDNVRGKESSLTGTKTKDKIKVYVNYQVIVFATRQIKFSDSIELSFSAKNDRDYNDVLNTIASAVVLNTQAAIYPPKIEKISKDNQVIFTQNLPLNAKLECYTRGEKIYDSYTKELNGYEESLSAVVMVVNTNPKTSYAKILEGSAKVGDVCRVKEFSPISDDANGKDVKDVIPVQGGGFIF